jgi:hypothetical protein
MLQTFNFTINLLDFFHQYVDVFLLFAAMLHLFVIARVVVFAFLLLQLNIAGKAIAT